MPGITLSATSSSTTRRSPAITVALAALLALYVFTRILQILPFSTPSTSIVALEILSTLAFALIHGAHHYRLRGILVFALICLVIGNILENLGVHTGFPYGHYEFLPLMGPQFFRVPILLGVAYIGMAYVSWTLARLILGATITQPKGAQLFTVPLLAAVVMTAWDFAQDPFGARSSTPGAGAMAESGSASHSPTTPAGSSPSSSSTSHSRSTSAIPPLCSHPNDHTGPPLSCSISSAPSAT